MISLRAYNREIEQLIDNGQFNESIAHCQFILSSFPKCIETYRVFGKSLLEQNKYSEALDLLTRVLSVFPDDFISHVGLSIIHEKQNNLNLAIWHMEQAFDVQPSNLAVQDELKRLFGKRDGEQPTKIRLTRGALVRMYARGELFQQAISEINAILIEDPRRIDLKVILAKMFFLSGLTEESINTCNQLIEIMPYCFEANRILQEIFASKNISQDVSEYRVRLIQIDPYYQFAISPFDEHEIPENKILIDKLSYIPTESIDTTVPVWKDNLTFEQNSTPDDNIEWLREISEQNEVQSRIISSSADLVKPEASQDTPDQNKESIQLPEWMKSAGWTNSADPVIEYQNKIDDTNLIENQIQDDLDLPDWIKDTNANFGIDHEIFDEQKYIDTNGTEEKLPSVTKDDLASLFSELKEGKMTNENVNKDEEKEDASTPSDWMSQFSKKESDTPVESADQNIPDWLKNFDNDNQDENNNNDDMPDWLKILQDEVEPPSQENLNAEELQSQEMQNDAGFLDDQASKMLFDESENNISSRDELSNDWKETTFAGLDESNSTDSPKDNQDDDSLTSEDTIPEWVKSVLLSNNENKSESNTDSLSDKEQSSEASAQSTSDFLEDSTTPNSDEGIISQQTNDELLDWLRGLKADDENSQITASDSITSEIETDKQNHTDTNTLNRLNEYASGSIDENSDSLNQENDETIMDESDNSPFAENQTIRIDNLASVLSDQIGPQKTNNIIEEINNTQLEMSSTPDVDIHKPLLSEIILNKVYDQIPNVVAELLDSGQDLDEIIRSIESISSDHHFDFSYWQNIGDTYSHHNRLNDALSAYQKAEELLIKSLSK